MQKTWLSACYRKYALRLDCEPWTLASKRILMMPVAIGEVPGVAPGMYRTRSADILITTITLSQDKLLRQKYESQQLTWQLFLADKTRPSICSTQENDPQSSRLSVYWPSTLSKPNPKCLLLGKTVFFSWELLQEKSEQCTLHRENRRSCPSAARSLLSGQIHWHRELLSLGAC